VDSDDSVAGRLAEQLLSFYGCTSDAHDACDTEYAQSPASYTTLSDILSSQGLEASVPDVLSESGFTEGLQLDEPDLLRRLYEGRSPPIEAGAEPVPPKKLYVPHKPSEHQNRRAQVTYDIDGLCLFPTSLAVAQQGLF
jgi:hypothetical protein